MRTLLLVEDDASISSAVAYSLERDGYRVITAHDGVSGLELARKERPDLVLLDVMLPGLSGLDVCRILRQEQSVPIVMLTARDQEPDKIQGFELGADDYITKPFSMRELRARIGSALRRDRLSRDVGAGERAASDVLSAGGLTLDRGAHVVTQRGDLVQLRPREFELLDYLMVHSGQALSRERILEAVWGFTYFGGTRTVDVHIRWLREKLEADPSQPQLIQTVRNVGYKFSQ